MTNEATEDAALAHAVRTLVRSEMNRADTQDNAVTLILQKLEVLDHLQRRSEEQEQRANTQGNAITAILQKLGLLDEIHAQVTGINDRLGHVEEFLRPQGYVPLGEDPR